MTDPYAFPNPTAVERRMGVLDAEAATQVARLGPSHEQRRQERAAEAAAREEELRAWRRRADEAQRKDRNRVLIVLVLMFVLGTAFGVVLPAQQPLSALDTRPDVEEPSTWWGLRPVFELFIPRFDMPLLNRHVPAYPPGQIAPKSMPPGEFMTINGFRITT